jgi:tetratricopeptide (TPR) repeat protein
MESWPEAAQIQSSESIGSFLLAVGDFVEAGQWASRAAERWPDRWLSHAILGKSLQLRGEPSRAIGGFRSAIENGATNPGVWRDLAVCQVAIRDLEAALATAAEAIERHPLYADSWAIRGVVELKKGNLTSALHFLSEAVRLAPEDPEILVPRAYCLIQMGRSKEAISSLQDALRLTPDSFEANFEMANAYHETGDDESAKPFLEKAKSLVPSDPRVFRLQEEIGRPVSQIGGKQ